MIDVLETGVILFAELTELSPAEEELQIEKRDQNRSDKRGKGKK